MSTPFQHYKPPVLQASCLQLSAPADFLCCCAAFKGKKYAKKPGRKKRPSRLPLRVRRAISHFSGSICKPKVLSSTGVRDFRGWLSELSSAKFFRLWEELLLNIICATGCDLRRLGTMKEDIVKDIIKCVVVPRPEESAKLVYTNARRQARKPRSGRSLMIVLESQIDRVCDNPSSFLEKCHTNGGRFGSAPHREDYQVQTGIRHSSLHEVEQLPSSTLPKPGNLDEQNSSNAKTTTELPSFQELSRSLQWRMLSSFPEE